MRAEAINLSNPILNYYCGSAPAATGDDARQVRQVAKDIILHWYNRTEVQLDISNIYICKIKDCFTESNAYYSASYIANKVSLPEEKVRSVLYGNNDIFQKSLIIMPDGKEVFMLKTRYSRYKDAWNAFRYLSHKKS